ncbi:MAG: energy-coupling factor ABC transporter permease [Candidatus Ozemobacteraceae bacterium]
MHIPDGFLNAPTAITCGLLSVAGVGVALDSASRCLPTRKVPLLGLSAAFVFAAQMLNFPVAAGTSGHLIGGVLCAVLLGPGAAVTAMSAVLILQCFFFADGGVTALGANLFNMALMAPIVGYGVYRGVLRIFGNDLRAHLVGTAFGSWCSTVAAAIACAGELSSSGIVPWNVVFPAMGFVHVLIGCGEAVITTLVVAVVMRARPELLPDRDAKASEKREWAMTGYGMILAMGLVLFVSPFACRWPDGLEKIATDLGFEHQAAIALVFPAPIPDYAVAGVTSPAWATMLAGVIGLVMAFTLAFLLGSALTRNRWGTEAGFPPGADSAPISR